VKLAIGKDNHLLISINNLTFKFNLLPLRLWFWRPIHNQVSNLWEVSHQLLWGVFLLEITIKEGVKR